MSPWFSYATDEVLDTDVREVWSGGYWKDKSNEGFYRFVILGGGIDHYKTKLYIQWITAGTDFEKPQVLKSVSINELNQTPVYSFGLPECIGDTNCSSVSIYATNVYDLSKHIIQIHLQSGVGVYSYESAAL